MPVEGTAKLPRHRSRPAYTTVANSLLKATTTKFTAEPAERRWYKISEVS